VDNPLLKAKLILANYQFIFRFLEMHVLHSEVFYPELWGMLSDDGAFLLLAFLQLFFLGTTELG